MPNVNIKSERVIVTNRNGQPDAPGATLFDLHLPEYYDPEKGPVGTGAYLATAFVLDERPGLIMYAQRNQLRAA